MEKLKTYRLGFLNRTFNDKIIIKDGMSDLEKDTIRLSNRMHETRACRLNAHKRLEKQHKLSSLSILSLSVVTIFISLIPNFNMADVVNKVTSDLLTLIGVVVSVFLIGLASMEVSNSKLLRGLKFHSNALKISRLWLKCKPIYIESNEDLKHTEKMYQDIIDELEDNHDPIDDYLYIRGNSHKSHVKRIFYGLFYSLSFLKYYAVYYIIILLSWGFIILTVFPSCKDAILKMLESCI